MTSAGRCPNSYIRLTYGAISRSGFRDRNDISQASKRVEIGLALRGETAVAWHVFRNAAGQRWEMNFSGMRLLAGAYCRGQLIHQNLKRTTTTEHLGLWFNLPITNIDIDWDTVKAKLPAAVRQFECGRPLWQSSLSQDTVDYLADIRRQTADRNVHISRLLRLASEANYAEWSRVDSSIARYSEFARLVRDGCFTFIVVASGAGALTAGEASTVAGVGSLLKGGADAEDNWKGSWTDTKMYESAIITTTTTFVSAWLPLKGNVAATKGFISGVAPRMSAQTTDFAANGILAIGSGLTDAWGDASKALVDGKSVSAALRIAATRAPTSLATSALGLALDGNIPGVASKFSIDDVTLSSKVTMPMLINLRTKTAAGVAADRIVEGQSGEAPMQTVPAPQCDAQFCMANAVGTSDREYILSNVLRPAAGQ